MARSMLDQIQIASPCHVSWDSMKGDERKRYCQSCKLSVFNISEMTRVEAEAFLESNSEGACVRLFRREDGTILTKDCPKGIRLVRQRFGQAAAAVVIMTFGAIAYALKPSVSIAKGQSAYENMRTQAKASPVIGPVIEKLDPTPKPVLSMRVGRISPAFASKKGVTAKGP